MGKLRTKEKTYLIGSFIAIVIFVVISISILVDCITSNPNSGKEATQEFITEGESYEERLILSEYSEEMLSLVTRNHIKSISCEGYFVIDEIWASKGGFSVYGIGHVPSTGVKYLITKVEGVISYTQLNDENGNPLLYTN